MTLRTCPNCGGILAQYESGHFVPPSLGQDGFFLCKQSSAGPDPDEHRRDRKESPPTLEELEAVTDEEITAELPGIFERILRASREGLCGESVMPDKPHECESRAVDATPLANSNNQCDL